MGAIRVPRGFPHCRSAIRYAEKVVGGRKVAGHYEIAACNRFLRDLDSSPYQFDLQKAERACRFMENFQHTKGRWARDKELFILEDWECFIVANIFGWVDEQTGLRRFTEAAIFVARKNGKSLLAAAIGHYMFVEDNEFGAEVYCGASTQKQAWEVYRPAKQMAERHESFADIYGIEIGAKTMFRVGDGSRFEPVIGSPGDGASPHCAIIDEFHEHRDSDLYDTMVTGMAARDQPLVLIITTAGNDVSSPCFEKDQECRKILDGTLRDETVFCVIYSADDDDEWTSVNAMKKANPNLDVSVSRAYLDRQLAKAKRSPARAAAYRTKNLNQWVSAGSAFLNILEWNSCGDSGLRLEDMEGKPCIFGLDLSSRIDITVLMRLFFEVDDNVLRYWLFPRFWIPENRTNPDDDDPNREKYAAWVDEGLLEVHDEDEIDFARLIADVRSEADLWTPREIAYDPWRAAGLEQTLSNEGYLMVKIPQIPSQMTDPLNELQAAHLARRIRHPDHPILNWMMSNLVVKEISGGKKPVKHIAQNKIDGCLATLIAMNRALAQDDAPSIYETQEPLII